MDGSFPTPTAQDISGSANFYNKCDNLLIVERDFTPNSHDVRVHVKKIRFRQSGKLGVIELKFDPNTGNYS
jgi:twinkle protein